MNAEGNKIYYNNSKDLAAEVIELPIVTKY